MKDASFLQRFYFVQFVFTTLYPMIPEHAGNQVLHVKHFVSPLLFKFIYLLSLESFNESQKRKSAIPVRFQPVNCHF